MENLDLPPWDSIDPALTPERLMALATIVRDETDAKIAARDSRDCNWNLGCDCHAWVLHRMHLSAKVEHDDWLHIESKPGDLDLRFRVGGKDGVKVKFYRPDAPGQPNRTLKQANEELRAIQQALGPELAPAPDPEVRLAIDKDEDGHVTAVRLAQLSLDGDSLYTWTVWSADDSVISIGDAPRPEGVDLEEPAVNLPEDEEEGEDENHNRNKQEGA